MKRIMVLLLFGALASVPLVFLSCGKIEQFTSPHEAELRNLIYGGFKKCGDSYYHSGYWQVQYTQYRNLHVEVNSVSLNEADRLNGVEWKGQYRYFGEAERRYVDHERWLEWEPSDDVYNTFSDQRWQNVELRNGEWSPSVGPSQVDCSNIPPG